MAKLELNGVTYDLRMSLWAMGQLEQEYGDLQETIKKFTAGRSISMTKGMFRILANAGLHARKMPETVTGDEIDDLGLGGLKKLTETLRRVMEESMEAETVGGGPADDEDFDVYADEMEKREKNGKAGGGSGSGSTTDTP